MRKGITSIVFLFCALSVMAQVGVKLNREYDYVGNDVNKAGLRVVGLEQTLYRNSNASGSTMLAKRTLYGCVDKNGNEVVPLKYDDIIIKQGWNFILVGSMEPSGYLVEDGKLTYYPWYTSYDFNKYYHEYASAKANYYGMLSADGQRTIIPVQYKEIIDPATIMQSGSVIVHKREVTSDVNRHANGFKDKYGVYDASGEIVFQVAYDHIKWLDKRNGILGTKLNDRWRVYEANGYEGTPFDYEDIVIYGDHIAAKKDGLWSIHEGYFEETFPGEYFPEIVGIENDVALVVNDGVHVALDLVNREQLCAFPQHTVSCYNGKTVWAKDKKSGKVQLFSVDGTLLNDMSRINKKYKSKRRYSSINFTEDDKEKMVSVYDEKEQESILFFFDDLGREFTLLTDARLANDSIRKADNERRMMRKPPTIYWLSDFGTVHNKDYSIVANVQSMTEIEDTYFIVNGKKVDCLQYYNNVNGFYSFDINAHTMLDEGSNLISVHAVNAAGLAENYKRVVYQPLQEMKPVIKWVDCSPTGGDNEFRLKVGVNSKSRIEDVNITVNGSLARGINTVTRDEYDMVVERVVNLMPGTNRIVVTARNADGETVLEKQVSNGVSDTIIDFADKRIALIIGNSNYSTPNLRLENPVNDATDLANKLKQLGFHVILKLDATLREIQVALADFGQQAKDYDVAFFFFAGHGVQNKDVNYLLPVNIDNLELNSGWEYECLNAQQVIDIMNDSKCRLKFAVLDACRNNALLTSQHRGTAARGLSSMNDTPDGTIIAFSTSPGHTASDGDGRNSPYTEAFLEALDRPNLNIYDFLQTVGALVKKKTNQGQIPWLSSSFTGSFYFNKQ